MINFLDLDDELLKYTDSSKSTARGLTSVEKDPKNFKSIGGEKYIKYAVVEPYLDQADAVAENLDPSYKHDGKAAPYGSGYDAVEEDMSVRELLEMEIEENAVKYTLEL